MSDVILYKEDIDRLNSILQTLVSETKIVSALLINKDTRLLAHQGTLAMFDMSALAALIVGSFASTQAIAGLIGDTEFNVMSHYGKSKNLLISVVDDNTILASIFDKTVSISAVTSGITRHVGFLQEALAAIGRNMESLFQEPMSMPSLSQDDVEQGFDSFFDQPKGGRGFAEDQPIAAPVSAPQQNRSRETGRVTPPAPETKHLELASVAKKEATPMAPARPQEETLTAAYTTEPGRTRSLPSAAARKIPPPSNTEYLYFTSMNYLKNKAKEKSAFQKLKNDKSILSRFFSRSK
jgi:predicted regulator of Ras-like GTPase activity (Roadblock/LC7/MglB family)